METDGSILKTDVDDFIDLVKKTGKITIKDAAKQLGITESTVEAWSDFLVEERILGIEYKFTTPYIYINVEDKESSRNLLGLETKDEFFEKAEAKKIPRYEAVMLWIKYLSANKDKIKVAFMEKAEGRGITSDKVSTLWKKYYEVLRST